MGHLRDGVARAASEPLRPLELPQLGERVGSLTAEAADWTGLPEGIAVCAGNVDAHVTAPAAKAIDPGQMLLVMGTSTCHVMNGDVLAEVEGPARSLLAAERTALNFLQRLSGIATLTRRFVDAVAGNRAVILDTRKTHPGYRLLEKYAVRMGGGQNHRMGLYDMVLIKDNHIAAAGSITAAVQRARAAYPHLPVEVEVQSLDQLREALELPVDRIMLDNFDLESIRTAVRIAAGRFRWPRSGSGSPSGTPAARSRAVPVLASQCTQPRGRSRGESRARHRSG